METNFEDAKMTCICLNLLIIFVTLFFQPPPVLSRCFKFFFSHFLKFFESLSFSLTIRSSILLIC